MQARTHTNIIEGNWNAVKLKAPYRCRTLRLVKISLK